MNFFKKYFGLFLVLILSFWAIKPFFVPGFFPMHDDTQVARVFEMGKMLGQGVFPVRWVPDLGYGYGYPLFNFYAPLAYYVGGIFMLLGFDALLATKLMMIVGIIASGVFMYLLAREFFREWGGIVAGIFYLYAPYHAVDIYVRGDAAEFWAYAFIPLAFLGIYKRSVLIGSVGFAAIILSHNLTAMMVTPFLLIAILLNYYIAFKNKKPFISNHPLARHRFVKAIAGGSLILIFGLALSTFYWAPALLEMKTTNVMSQIGGGADFRDHFVCIGQLWDSSWGFGGSIPGCIDGFSFKIGKLHILSVALSLLTLVYLKLKGNHFNNAYYLIVLSIIGFFISVFLMLDISKFLWESVSAMSFFQYPWRFLLLASFFSSLIGGSLVLLLSRFRIMPYVVFVVLVSIVLFFNAKLFSPQTIINVNSDYYTNDRALKWVASKTSDEFLPPNFKKPKSEHEVSDKPILFKETNLEKVANSASFIGLLVLIIGIILFKGKKI
ncbi:MAG: hypothetical protein Q8P26_04920 [Candidatus Levybacteria bacterium]|nr:hypothetical protein [Candidatus Levybacteria bacterium]